MSWIIRARNGLTGRWEGSEVIGGSVLELKVAGPSMLGIGCPDRHLLPRITPSKMRWRQRVLPPARAGAFTGRFRPFPQMLLRTCLPEADVQREPTAVALTGETLR